MLNWPSLDFGDAQKSQKRAIVTKIFVKSCREMVNTLHQFPLDRLLFVIPGILENACIRDLSLWPCVLGYH